MGLIVSPAGDPKIIAADREKPKIEERLALLADLPLS